MSYRATRWLYLRLLGCVFLVAFASLLPQVSGLVGPRGLMPAGEFLDRTRAALGAVAYWKLPTLAWLSTSERFLEGLCAAGVVLGALLALGVAQRAVLALAWALYLSLVVAGQTFLGFQWDVLLLEAGLLSLVVAPGGVLPRRPGDESRPWAPGIWLLRVLLFKLMFLSGATKLLSLDETWWNLTALDFHYFTQPLPAWTSWYAHNLPAWFQRVSVVVMFAVELIVPFLVFGPRLARAIAFGALVLFQLAIAATGNYGFFNLLTLVLCIPVLDDELILRRLPTSLRPALGGRAAGSDRTAPGRPATLEGSWMQRIAPGLLVLFVLALQAISLGQELGRTAGRNPGKLGAVGRSLDWAGAHGLDWGEEHLLRPLAPLRSCNGYGLFRVMSEVRPELILEASADGTRWEPIELRYKPGDPSRAPSFVQPHMPRLDWQLWFAALDPRSYAFLLDRLERRIFEGSPPVRELIGLSAPPPRYLRVVLYRYEFTTPAERRASGEWWKRERLGVVRTAAL